MKLDILPKVINFNIIEYFKIKKTDLIKLRLLSKKYKNMIDTYLILFYRENIL